MDFSGCGLPNKGCPPKIGIQRKYTKILVSTLTSLRYDANRVFRDQKIDLFMCMALNK